MTTTLQYPTLMEQAITQLRDDFHKFETKTESTLKEIKEGLLGNQYNKKGIVDRTDSIELRVDTLESIVDDVKSKVKGATWSVRLSMSIGAAIIVLVELAWKIFAK